MKKYRINGRYLTIGDKLIDFSFICKEYGLAKDSSLSNGALELKKIIIKHVEEFYDKYSEKY